MKDYNTFLRHFVYFLRMRIVLIAYKILTRNHQLTMFTINPSGSPRTKVSSRDVALVFDGPSRAVLQLRSVTTPESVTI